LNDIAHKSSYFKLYVLRRSKKAKNEKKLHFANKSAIFLFHPPFFANFAALDQRFIAFLQLFDALRSWMLSGKRGKNGHSQKTTLF
jgi:hypothetical protein